MMKFFRAVTRWVVVGAIAAIVVVALPSDTFAAGLIPEPTGKCPDDYMVPGRMTPLDQACANGAERDYRLDDFKSLLAIIGNFMIGISGTIVLLCFVVGAFFWISSAGNSKMVEKGKALISGAVIGLIIMFIAYTAVTFVVRTLTGTNDYAPSAVAPSPTTAGGSAVKTKEGQITALPQAYTTSDYSNIVCSALLKGTCTPKGTCSSSFTVTNGCGHTNGAEVCCMGILEPAQQTSCGRAGGTCMPVGTDKEKAKCNGAIVKGLCDAKGMGANIQCCFTGNPASAAPTTVVPLKQGQITYTNPSKEADKASICSNVINGSCVSLGQCTSGASITNGCSDSAQTCCRQSATANADKKTTCERTGGSCMKAGTSTEKAKCGGVFVKGLCENTGSTTQCCYK